MMIFCDYNLSTIREQKPELVTRIKERNVRFLLLSFKLPYNAEMYLIVNCPI